jgi:hypothetical protein
MSLGKGAVHIAHPFTIKQPLAAMQTRKYCVLLVAHATRTANVLICTSLHDAWNRFSRR